MRYPPHRRLPLSPGSCEAGGTCEFETNSWGERECKKCGIMDAMVMDASPTSLQLSKKETRAPGRNKDFAGNPLSKRGRGIHRLQHFYGRREDRTQMQKRAELVIERIHLDQTTSGATSSDTIKSRKQTLKKALEKKRELLQKKANIPESRTRLAPSGRNEGANAVCIAFAVELYHRQISLGPTSVGVSSMIELMRETLPRTEYPDLLDTIGEDKIRKFLSKDFRHIVMLLGRPETENPDAAKWNNFMESLGGKWRSAFHESGLKEREEGAWDGFMGWCNSQDSSRMAPTIPEAHNSRENTGTELLYLFLDCTRAYLLDALGQPRKRTDSGRQPATALREMWVSSGSNYDE